MADDAEILALLGQLPTPKRQPNLPVRRGPAIRAYRPARTRISALTWYQTSGWTKPYPGEDRIYAPVDVPGAYLPSPDGDG